MTVSQSARRFGTVCFATALALAGLALATPAQAHTCAAYDGCDASTCKDGEDHEHTNYNRVGRDEYCKSEKRPDEGDEDCRILGVSVPKWVCEQAAGLVTRYAVSPGGGLQKIEAA